MGEGWGEVENVVATIITLIFDRGCHLTLSLSVIGEGTELYCEFIGPLSEVHLAMLV